MRILLRVRKLQWTVVGGINVKRYAIKVNVAASNNGLSTADIGKVALIGISVYGIFKEGHHVEWIDGCPGAELALEAAHV